jgi:hypothetical protein
MGSIGPRSGIGASPSPASSCWPAAHPAGLQPTRHRARRPARRRRRDRHARTRAVGDPAAMAVGGAEADARPRGRRARRAGGARGPPHLRRLRALAGAAPHDGPVRRGGLRARRARRDAIRRGAAPTLELRGGRRHRPGLLPLPRAAGALLPVAARLPGADRTRGRRGRGRDRDGADRPAHGVRAGPVRHDLHRGQGRLAPPPVHHHERAARGRRARHGQGARRLHVAASGAHRAGHAGRHRRPPRALQPLEGHRSAVWIAGGVGVAPFLSWLRALDGHQLPHRVDSSTAPTARPRSPRRSARSPTATDRCTRI